MRARELMVGSNVMVYPSNMVIKVAGVCGFYLTNSSQMDIAKHFFELGVSVSSTKVTTSDIDDVLKENGVNPYSKEAKIIKESYFMAIEKLAQKGEKV